jgi:hypothetical protein
MTHYQVGVAAESLVASLLSQAGYDVSVQYGANQPGYDLVAIKPGRTLKVSVKGTQLPGWALTSGWKSGRSYAGAIEDWLKAHGPDLLFIFVQFRNVTLGSMPCVYVARAREVAAHMKASKNGHGDTTLRWNHAWKSGCAKGCTDSVPAAWCFSQGRIEAV